jgi:hypothetical protein
MPVFRTSTAIMFTVGVEPASVGDGTSAIGKNVIKRINRTRFMKSLLFLSEIQSLETPANLHSKIPWAAGYKAGSKVNGRIGASSIRPFGCGSEGANTRAHCPGEIVKFIFANLFELKG